MQPKGIFYDDTYFWGTLFPDFKAADSTTGLISFMIGIGNEWALSFQAILRIQRLVLYHRMGRNIARWSAEFTKRGVSRFGAPPPPPPPPPLLKHRYR